MKIEIIKNEDGTSAFVVPDHILEALGWETGDELKMEVARDFDFNPTTLVVMRRRKDKK
jgi:antitoxin component of MazEF toxin-antitoxin module